MTKQMLNIDAMLVNPGQRPYQVCQTYRRVFRSTYLEALANTDYVVELHLIENAFGRSIGLLQSGDDADYSNQISKAASLS